MTSCPSAVRLITIHILPVPSYHISVLKPYNNGKSPTNLKSPDIATQIFFVRDNGKTSSATGIKVILRALLIFNIFHQFYCEHIRLPDAKL